VPIHPIVQLGHPALRLPAVLVPPFDRRLWRLLDDMVATMRAAPGVGLAANQIARPERVCVIEVEDRLFELIDPRIVRMDGEQSGLEGCLSVSGFYAPVARAERVWATARDRHGRKIHVQGVGLLARAIQHEVGHLDGLLYLDRLDSFDDLIDVRDDAPEPD
jgi:peptide deformylase